MPTIIDSLIVKLGLDSKDLESRVPGVTKGLKGIEAEQKKTEAANKKVSKSFGEVTKGLGSFLAVIGGTVAIKAFIFDVIDSSSALDRLSKNLGTSVETLSAWTNSTERLGGSAQGLQGTFDMLSKAQTELKLTGQSSLIPYLSALGISLATVNGQARPVDELLLNLAERFSRMDRTTANNMGRMMGIDQGTMNLLLQGRQELELTLKRQKEANVVTKQQAEEATKLKKSITDIKLTFSAFGRSLLQEAAPALEWVLKTMISFSDWVHQNREAVTDFLKIMGVGLAAIGVAALPIDLLVIAVLALAAGIALLWQDYQTWKRGGDSFIDWEKWEPGIKNAVNGINWLKGALENLYSNNNFGAGIKAIGDSFDWLTDKVRKASYWVTRGAELMRLALNHDWVGMGVLAGQISTENPADFGKIKAKSSTAKPSDTASYIQQYFKDRGWSGAQAAGITANVMRESRGNINAVGDKGSSYGLAQWHPDRQADFAKFTGRSIQGSSLDQQLAFIQHELSQGKEKAAGDALRKALSAQDAGEIVSRSYERPADANGEASMRGSYAQSLVGIKGVDKYTQSLMNSLRSSPNAGSVDKSVSIDQITVNTKATDADGIAKDLGQSLDYLFTSQANTGLN